MASDVALSFFLSNNLDCLEHTRSLLGLTDGQNSLLIGHIIDRVLRFNLAKAEIHWTVGSFFEKKVFIGDCRILWNDNNGDDNNNNKITWAL